MQMSPDTDKLSSTSHNELVLSSDQQLLLKSLALDTVANAVSLLISF
jgi:hypothetical protein